MKHIFTILLLAAAVNVTSAQEAPAAQKTMEAPESDTSKVWSLSECMRYAVEKSPKTVRSQIAADNAKDDYTSAILNHLPSLNAGVGASAGFGRSVDPATNTYTDVANFNNSYSVSAGIAVFNGLGLLNNTRISRISKLRGELEVQRVMDNVAIETMDAFFNYHYVQGAVALAREQVDASEATLVQSRRMMELGIRSVADVAQVEADLAANRFALIRTENQQRSYELVLKDKMNFPIEYAIKIDTTHATGLILSEATSASEIVSGALRSLPQAQTSGIDVKISKIRIGTAIAKLFPSISASANIGSSYYTNIDGRVMDAKPFHEQFKNNLSEGVGLSMNIPLFSAWGRGFDIRRSKNNYKTSQQNNIETQRQIAVEVEGAIMDLDGAISEQTQAEKQVNARAIAYRVAQQKYGEGLLSAIDLQTTSNQLLQARSNLLQAQLSCMAKRKLVDYYKGIPLLEEQ